jgi:hypothetical protein
VLHDEVHTVGGDQTLDVFARRTKTIDGGETETVVLDRNTTIEADDVQTVALAEQGGGKDQDTVDGAGLAHVKLTRTTTIDKREHGTFQESREEEVTGVDALHVSQVREVVADQEWKAVQGKTQVVLTDGHALAKADGEIEATTSQAQVLLVPGGTGVIKVVALKIHCGNSHLTLSDAGMVLKSTTVLVRGDNGVVTVDPTGVKTAGKDISSSAKMLNEIKGALVMISDTPGAFDPLAPKKQQVQFDAGPLGQLRLQHAEEDPLSLEVTLLGNDAKPAANTAYQLMLPTGELFQGKTDGAGKLKQDLPGASRTAHVSFEPVAGEGVVFRTMAMVDDASDAAPIAQLRQLGFGGDTSPAEEVVREFQATHRLDETGQMDGPTKDALAALRSGRGRKG